MQTAQYLEPYADRCLECVIDQRRVAVSLDSVDQLIQYDRRPLPLPAPHVGGIGIHDGKIVISVCTSAKPRQESTNTKAILLRGLTGATPWALEVDDTFSFVDVVRHQGASHPLGFPWIIPANALDGRAFEWLDLPRLISSLSGNIST